ncbi:MAG: hypothetical protein HYR55_05470 [Acidobacteria bacterium]|nr:hypothetical protein [Acidobacteriota bacterium]MBI3657807.1 hypothetical protein [Acidobacteriota bacterium]
MRRSQVIISLFLFLTAVILIGNDNTMAMPNFARKLGVECAFCHTTIPKLNEVGFKFRAAGFRLPDEIGKPEAKTFDLGDYFSGRIQARYDANRMSRGLVSSRNNRLTFHELTVYPVTGSWGKYFSSLVELSYLPEDHAEIENAYIRASRGDSKMFVGGRVGIFHPFEGYGASDRPVSLSRPFFQTNGANFTQPTFFTPWNFDQAGAEVGVDYGRTSFRVTMFNGLLLREEDGVLKPFAAQGGVLNKATVTPAHNTPDVQMFFNQIIHEQGGAISVYYYHGNLGLPINGVNSVAGFFRNNFDRVAIYGSYPIAKQLHLLGGFQSGRDHTVTKDTFTSRGAFAEVDVPINDYVTAGLRYDWFDRARDKKNNDLWGLTTFANVPIQNGLQFIAEYQHKDARFPVGPNRKDDAFQVRFIFIK